MNVMIALPGDQYYAVPREELEKYAVPKDQFERDVESNLSAADAEAASGGDVEGQEDRPPRFIIRTKTAVMGVRG